MFSFNDLSHTLKRLYCPTAAAVGSKTYILRSVLHPLIIEHAAQTDENILEQEVTDLPGNDDEGDDDEGYVPQCYGSIISWSQTDYLGPIGLLYTLLALILVSGRVLSDGACFSFYCTF